MAIVQNPPSPGAILDCGHALDPQPIGLFTTGYGIRREADGRETFHCYACCHAADVEALRTGDRAFGYLTTRGTDARLGYQITNWPGGHLMRVTWAEPRDVPVFGRRAVRWYLNAIDVHGQHWFGTSPGPGMYARMRRAKGKAAR